MRVTRYDIDGDDHRPDDFCSHSKAVDVLFPAISLN